MDSLEEKRRRLDVLAKLRSASECVEKGAIATARELIMEAAQLLTRIEIAEVREEWRP